MRQIEVYVDKQLAGILTEENRQHYVFEYDHQYHGLPVSLTMPLTQKKYEY
ncbi:MAG: HipA N-terminal domain-containing protein [Gammaproteobacteria bacterium]|nr:HipA N-terminal domain-containing protein [Gammaproteobacteria bacterium]